MLITDSFLMLNLPKTGSTFARKVIKKAYGEFEPSLKDKVKWKLGLTEKKVKELFLENLMVNHRNDKTQHGIYDQIPDEYKNSDYEIVSIMRDPFTAYISRYNFKFWQKVRHPNTDLGKNKFPHFPDLTLSEYIDFCNMDHSHRLQGVTLNKGVSLGQLSLQYIQMFSKEHKKVLPMINKTFLNSDEMKDYFPNITFLKTENLNNDLFQFLSSKGVSKENLAFLRTERKINVSTTKKYKDYLTKDIVDKIMDLEWFLFSLYPEYKPENNKLFQD
ncbi:MAG: hypothetical protein WD607_00365 [Candidatus Paceibacterota bacterium]